MPLNELSKNYKGNARECFGLCFEGRKRRAKGNAFRKLSANDDPKRQALMIFKTVHTMMQTQPQIKLCVRPICRSSPLKSLNLKDVNVSYLSGTSWCLDVLQSILWTDSAIAIGHFRLPSTPPWPFLWISRTACTGMNHIHRALFPNSEWEDFQPPTLKGEMES